MEHKNKKTILNPKIINGIPETSVETVFEHLQDSYSGKLVLIDVRGQDEFNNELGHIIGAKLITLGKDLTNFLEASARDLEIIFICRSGARSATATIESMRLGYKYTTNMTGGMIRWNEQRLPVEKN